MIGTVAISVADTVPLEVRSSAPVTMRSNEIRSMAASSATMIHERGIRVRLTGGVSATPVIAAGTLIARPLSTRRG